MPPCLNVIYIPAGSPGELCLNDTRSVDCGQNIVIPTNVPWCSQMHSGLAVNDPHAFFEVDVLLTLGYCIRVLYDLYALPLGDFIVERMRWVGQGFDYPHAVTLIG